MNTPNGAQHDSAPYEGVKNDSASGIEPDDADDRGSLRTCPLRTCIVTRNKLGPEALIRFVADPSGQIVPDLACKLPGRGVWVTCDKKALAEAIKRRAFAKSLKAAVVADAGLVAKVEGLLVLRAQNALSLANKAGRVVAGFAKVDALAGSGDASVLVHACDAAIDGAGKLDRKQAAVCRATSRALIIVTDLNSQQLGLALGLELVIHVGLKSGGATTKFVFEAQRLSAFRCDTSSALTSIGVGEEPAVSAAFKSLDTGQE